ncbi:MAG: hypothetical protein ACFCUX_04395 [Candidatus Methylacidiphilales bacterium]
MSESRKVCLKKKSEDEIHGPMEIEELIELSRSAFIAPEDEACYEGEAWMPAPDMRELEMIWIIRTADGIEYGPTTTGTIREFLMVGEISEETLIFHKETQEEKTVGALLGDTTLSEVREEQRLAEVETALQSEPEEISRSMDVARDLRIRQLEVDLEELESKYNSLMLKYRKVTEELTAFKQK